MLGHWHYSTTRMSDARRPPSLPPVRLLLAITFALTLARAITLPYLVVYLADNFQLPVSHIGLLIGGALILASLLSLYGGHLVDTLSNYALLIGAMLTFALAFVGAIASRWAALFFLCLVLINLALAVVDIAAKAGFAHYCQCPSGPRYSP